MSIFFCFFTSEHTQLSLPAAPERISSPQPKDSSSAAAMSSAAELRAQVGRPDHHPSLENGSGGLRLKISLYMWVNIPSPHLT